MLTDGEWRAESAGIEMGFLLAIGLLESMGVAIDRPALLAAAAVVSRDEGPIDSAHQRERRGAVLRHVMSARRLLAHLPRGWASEPLKWPRLPDPAGIRLTSRASSLPA